MESKDIPVLTAFIAGLFSFFSPCVLPMLPTFAALLGGSAGETAEDNRVGRWRFFINIFFFLSGFTLVFVAMGATASYFGRFFIEYQDIVRKIGAVFITFMGLHLMGIFGISSLQREYRPFLKQTFRGPFGAFVLGIAFTAGWTPCIGPILAAILAYAGTNAMVGQGVVLLLVFSLGFSLPFWALAFFLQRFLPRLRRVYQWLPLLQRVAGGILLITGIVLYFDLLQRILGVLLSF
ncbi:MAG: cytochrome c biosis protein transrane region [Firmicutes bacterium]|nr:cytochrome c biosis protein transrane region [Bacillota bacterium]